MYMEGDQKDRKAPNYSATRTISQKCKECEKYVKDIEKHLKEDCEKIDHMRPDTSNHGAPCGIPEEVLATLQEMEERIQTLNEKHDNLESSRVQNHQESILRFSIADRQIGTLTQEVSKNSAQISEERGQVSEELAKLRAQVNMIRNTAVVDKTKSQKKIQNITIVAFLILAVITGVAYNQKNQLADEFEEKIGALSSRINNQLDKMKSAICGQFPCMPPFDIKVSNYEESKKKESYIKSPHFITHPGPTWNYVYLEVYLNGYEHGHGTHVSIHVGANLGEERFPLGELTLTVQLVNQQNNKPHWERKIKCEMESSDLEYFTSCVGSDNHFISHTLLESKFLEDDQLLLRISDIEFVGRT